MLRGCLLYDYQATVIRYFFLPFLMKFFSILSTLSLKFLSAFSPSSTFPTPSLNVVGSRPQKSAKSFTRYPPQLPPQIPNQTPPPTTLPGPPQRKHPRAGESPSGDSLRPQSPRPADHKKDHLALWSHLNLPNVLGVEDLFCRWLPLAGTR